MADIERRSDLLLCVMNLIEAEHHARFSFLSTNNDIWLKYIDIIRKLRAKYMRDIEREEDSQLHCFNKHTLSASFRLFEVGDKFLSEGDTVKAKECYNDAYDLIMNFMELNWVEQEKKEKGFLDKILKKDAFRPN